MGYFYVNITTRKASTEEIGNYLRSKKMNAFVICGPDSYCTIYEEGCDEQDMSYISSLLKDISRRLSCTAFGVLNHDDDILMYEMWSKGEKLDEYNSCPGYFSDDGSDMEPVGGNAYLLSRIMGNGTYGKEIDVILRSSNEDEFIFAIDRHQKLVELLGLPINTVGHGFGDLSDGEIPEGIRVEDIRRFNV